MKFIITIWLSVSCLISADLMGQDIELGAGLGYGNHTKTPTINFRMFYKLKNKIEIGPDFQYAFKNKNSDEFVIKSVLRKDFSVLSRLVLQDLDILSKVRFYPLLGLSLVSVKTDGESNFSSNPIFQVESDKEVFLGALVGLGGKYELKNSFTLFSEIKYHYSKESQTTINAGVAYIISLPFVNDNE